VTTFTLGSVNSIIVNGLGGNDQLLGRTNLQKPLSLRGGEGNDTLVGGARGDIFQGGNGYDRADYSHRSNNLNISLDDLTNDGALNEKDNVKSDIELIMTGRGSDLIRGNDFDNFIYPGAGNDTVYGMGGHDLIGLDSTSAVERKTVYGGEGNDSISMSGQGQASVFGENGNDTINGGSGADVLDGGAGFDQISGNSGNDTIRGGTENDTLSGNAGEDQISGDDGNDTIYGNVNPLSLVGKFGSIKSGKFGEIILDPIFKLPPLLAFVSDKDVLSGGEGSDAIYGGDGADRISGGGWRDSLYGGDGNDVVEGGTGDDIIEGNDGDDVLWGNRAPSPFDNIRIDIGGIFGNPPPVLSDVDVIFGGNGNDQLHGNGDGDTLSGGDDNDKMWGDGGNDVFRGNGGNDSLYGGDGDDNLGGDEGDDILIAIGGGNFDSLYGGTGSDQFWCDDVSTERTDADLGEILFGNVHKVASFANNVSKNLYGQNLNDPNSFDNRGNTNPADDVTPPFTNFSGNPLFGDAGPRDSDINQGQVGNCYFLAALAAEVRVLAFKIKQRVVELGDGTYAVQFRRNGLDEFYRVDGDLPVTFAGSTTPYYGGLGAQNSVWAAIMEKAFCFFRSGAATYASISSGDAREGFDALGMRAGDNVWDSTSGSKTLRNIKDAMDRGQVVTLSTQNTAPPAGIFAVQNHAYAVVSVNTIPIWIGGIGTGSLINVISSITLRNPWGVDGNGAAADGVNDGLVTFTASQIQQYFNGARTAYA
jgi:Ca2+-binding RTX toxin-like protein